MKFFKKIGIAILLQIITYFIHFIFFPLFDLDVPYVAISSFIIIIICIRFQNIGLGYFILSTPIYPVLIELYNPFGPYDTKGGFGLDLGLRTIVIWWIVSSIQLGVLVLWKIWIIAKKLHDDK